MKTALQSRLMVALDVSSGREALALAESLAPLGVGFKIGMELFYAEGAGLIRTVQALQAHDFPVFVDLKLHDIPNTVGRAIGSLTAQGVSFVNVHTQGGLEMMRAAKSAAGPETLVIGVTLLTSLDEAALHQQLKVPDSVSSYVLHLAQQAQTA